MASELPLHNELQSQPLNWGRRRSLDAVVNSPSFFVSQTTPKDQPTESGEGEAAGSSTGGLATGGNKGAKEELKSAIQSRRAALGLGAFQDFASDEKGSHEEKVGTLSLLTLSLLSDQFQTSPAASPEISHHTV